MCLYIRQYLMKSVNKEETPQKQALDPREGEGKGNITDRTWTVTFLDQTAGEKKSATDTQERTDYRGQPIPTSQDETITLLNPLFTSNLQTTTGRVQDNNAGYIQYTHKETHIDINNHEVPACIRSLIAPTPFPHFLKGKNK